MRMSVDKTDPGFRCDANEYAVRFNGDLAWFVQTADEEAGFIEFFSVGGDLVVGDRPANITHVDINVETGAPARSTRHGSVNITHHVDFHFGDHTRGIAGTYDDKETTNA